MSAADWYAQTKAFGSRPHGSTACGPNGSRGVRARPRAGNVIDFYAIDYPEGDERYWVQDP